MKKLMFAAAMVAVGTAFAVESSNIVGYINNGKAADDVYKAVGPTFTTVGTADGTITLRALVPGDGYDWQDDYIFVINPSDCSADAELQYLTKAEFPKLSEDGWYESDGSCWNDEEFSIGTGFQTSFAAGGAFTLQNSGQVHQDGYSIETDGTSVYMFPVNGTARTITYGEMLPSDGYDWQDDFIFVVNPEDCSADAELQYLTKAEFPKLAGDGWYEGDGTCWNDEEIAAGEGFQTSFASGSAFDLDFPAL